MQVGDLVKYRCPATTQIGKAYLVVWKQDDWIRLLERKYADLRCAHHIRDFEVVSAGGRKQT